MDRVKIDVQNGIADIRFSRPEKLNAFDLQMFEDVAAAIERLSGLSSVRCVVLSGEGRAFSVGIDIKLLASSALGDLIPRYKGSANLFQHVAVGSRSLNQPVIAAVHGFAYGAGFHVMLGADIRICSPDAQLSIMEARWGLASDMGGIALMRELVANDVARELTYTARRVDGGEAQQLGLVTKVAQDPHASAMLLAKQIAEHSPDAIAAAKRLQNRALESDMDAILLAESQEQQVLLRSAAHRLVMDTQTAKS